MDEATRLEHVDRITGFQSAWGLSETILDLCIISLFHDHGGRAINPNPPVTLERKLGFLKDCFDQIPALAAFQDLATAIRLSFTADKYDRNTIVHAAPMKIEKNGTTHFLRINHGKDAPVFELRVVKPKEWDRLSEACAERTADLLVLLFGLSPRSILHHSQDAGREGGMLLFGKFPLGKRVADLLQERFAGETRD